MSINTLCYLITVRYLYQIDILQILIATFFILFRKKFNFFWLNSELFFQTYQLKMPKLLQDGVVIMPSNQTPPLFPYNDDGYYRGTIPINQHQSPGLVVKNLEVNGPYPPYANTSRNYEYTLSGHSESTKHRSCSRGSKERNLLHSSLYPHRDDYLVQNRTVRADNNYFDYTYNPRYLVMFKY